MYYYYYYFWWGGTKSLGTAATPGLLYKPQVIDEDDFWSNWWNEDWQGKPNYSEKTCPSAALSTTKSHMTRPGLEPRTAVVGSQWLTAWAMARPLLCITNICFGKVIHQHNKNGFSVNQYYSDWIYFLTAACFGPHGTIIRQYYVIRLRLIELTIWIHILV
jgi:hypothetical protein